MSVRWMARSERREGKKEGQDGRGSDGVKRFGRTFGTSGSEGREAAAALEGKEPGGHNRAGGSADGAGVSREIGGRGPEWRLHWRTWEVTTKPARPPPVCPQHNGRMSPTPHFTPTNARQHGPWQPKTASLVLATNKAAECELQPIGVREAGHTTRLEAALFRPGWLPAHLGDALLSKAWPTPRHTAKLSTVDPARVSQPAADRCRESTPVTGNAMGPDYKPPYSPRVSKYLPKVLGWHKNGFFSSMFFFFFPSVNLAIPWPPPGRVGLTFPVGPCMYNARRGLKRSARSEAAPADLRHQQNRDGLVLCYRTYGPYTTYMYMCVCERRRSSPVF